MLTQEQNEFLTRVGPGTPCGELLRRYWYPIAVAKELTEEHPAHFVRILGEDLVLFRDKKGRVGLLDDRCPHRGIVMLRELLKQEIEKAQRGVDPLGVIRDQDHPMIDTNLTKSITMHYPTGIAARTAAAER